MAIVTTHIAAVQQLYVAYFNRPADYAGLDYWTNVVAAQNGSTVAVSAAFAAEAEYRAEYANLSNSAIVNKVYQNLFGRPAEDAGRVYWADLLTRGSITIDKVVAEIAKGAQTTDLEAYENKVVAATAFTNALDTPAERTGYAGVAANAVAKTFLSSVTTDASLTAALAPAALSATVAASVKAGTPFTLVSGLAALESANEGVADFLATLDLDDDEDTDTTAADVEDAADDAEADVAALITVGTAVPANAPANYLAASDTVKAALLQDQIEANAEALADAEEALDDAQEAVEEVEGLGAAIEIRAAAITANTAAIRAVTTTSANMSGAEATYEALIGGSITIDPTAGTVPGVIVANASGTLSVATGVTAANRPAATALLNAIVANRAAVVDAAAAADELYAARLQVNLLDESAAEEATRDALVALVDEDDVGEFDGLPTAEQILLQQEILEEGGAGTAAALASFNTALNNYVATDTTANNPLATAVVNAAAAVEAASDAVADLADAVAAQDEAQANAAELAALEAAVEAAVDAFGENDFRDPVVLGASAAGTAGADIFVVEDAMTTTITGFGRVGSDALFIGSGYTLNSGAITTGNNAVLEVFFIQSGTSTQVRLETEVYGSDSAAVAEQVITLTGVTATDLVLENGIITLKGATGG